MNSFTIRDLENLSGIKALTIRIWELRYNFLRPNRTGTNIRYYCNEELKTVLNISLLNKYGYKISHIDKMSEGEHHELDLLYVYYLLKNRGAKPKYLGANMPITDVEFVAKQKNPDYL